MDNYVTVTYQLHFFGEGGQVGEQNFIVQIAEDTVTQVHMDLWREVAAELAHRKWPNFKSSRISNLSPEMISRTPPLDSPEFVTSTGMKVWRLLS